VSTGDSIATSDVNAPEVLALIRTLNETLVDVRRLVQQDDGKVVTLLNEVADRAEETGRVIESGARLVDAYAERDDELRRLISEFSEVAETVAERNDALVDAVSRIADGEEELERLVADNDREIRDALAALDDIGTVLSASHDELEDIFAFTGTGIVQYHRISRWGQWFNIRVPGLSVGEEVVTTERGACLPARLDPDSDERHHRTSCDNGTAGAGFFAGALTGLGDAGGGR
jgi:phospholipid/cholesterol/gamma-HCH transport system substrate-binding protein